MTDTKGLIDKEGWIYCPVCGSKTRTKIHFDTVANRWPLYCRKCNQESIIEIENMNIKLSSEPDAMTQSR